MAIEIQIRVWMQIVRSRNDIVWALAAQCLGSITTKVQPAQPTRELPGHVLCWWRRGGGGQDGPTEILATVSTRAREQAGRSIKGGILLCPFHAILLLLQLSSSLPS